jgi:hypothetical protein
MSASASDSTLSFIENPSVSSTSREDIDSLPESLDNSNSDSDDGDSSDYSDAEREWRESLQQLELLLSMVVVPYLGKYVGRKCAYWGESCSQACWHYYIVHCGILPPMWLTLFMGPGWAKFMRWKYPVEVVVTSKTASIVAGGSVAALSPL